MCAPSKEHVIVRRVQNTCLFGCGSCCGFGWLVAPIRWAGWAWAYNIAWIFVLGNIRMIAERIAFYRTGRHTRSVDMVNQSLLLHVA
jgi:hypothetical protein